MKCRCGWDGVGEHPCHGKGYTCRKAAKERFYESPVPCSLAGAQLKFNAIQTWACDTCWAFFKEKKT